MLRTINEKEKKTALDHYEHEHEHGGAVTGIPGGGSICTKRFFW